MGRERGLDAPGPVKALNKQEPSMTILTLPAPVVNFDFAVIAPAVETDDYRPTAGPDFTPTLEEETEAAELLNGDDADAEPTDDEWEAMAEAAYAMDRVCSGPIL